MGLEGVAINRKRNYQITIIFSLVLITLLIIVGIYCLDNNKNTPRHRTQKWLDKLGWSEEMKEKDNVVDLISDIIKSARDENNITDKAYVICEVLLDNDYNAIQVDITIVDAIDANITEYNYFKQQEGSLQKSTTKYNKAEYPLEQNVLLLSEFEKLIPAINKPLLDNDNATDFLLTVRYFSKGNYKWNADDEAYQYLEGNIIVTESIDNRVGLCIKGNKMVAVFLE